MFFNIPFSNYTLFRVSGVMIFFQLFEYLQNEILEVKLNCTRRRNWFRPKLFILKVCITVRAYIQPERA